jgi:hypothetical protein
LFSSPVAKKSLLNKDRSISTFINQEMSIFK